MELDVVDLSNSTPLNVVQTSAPSTLTVKKSRRKIKDTTTNQVEETNETKKLVKKAKLMKISKAAENSTKAETNSSEPGQEDDTNDVVTDQDCNVCCKPIRSRNPNVSCPMCKYQSCKQCWQMFIKGKLQEPACMECKHILGDMWLRSNLSKSFFDTEVKNIRKNAAWQREQALLPPTQDRAKQVLENRRAQLENNRKECVLEAYKLQQNMLHSYFDQINLLVTLITDYQKRVKAEAKKDTKEATIQKQELDILERRILCRTSILNLDKYDFVKIENINLKEQKIPDLEELKLLKTVLKTKCNEIDAYIQQNKFQDRTPRFVGVGYNARNGTDASGDAQQETKRIFTRGCPQNDCRGFITPLPGNHRLGCALCNTECCIRCHIVLKNKDELEDNTKKHECKESDIETVKALKDQTKDCPRCHALIFKISGCDVMFCTACNTAFSWNTGSILDANRVHNPHLAQFLAKGGNLHGTAANTFQHACEENNVREQIYSLSRTLQYFLIFGDFIFSLSSTDQDRKTRFMNALIILSKALSCASIIYGSSGRFIMQNMSEATILRERTDIRVKYLVGDIDVKRLQTEILKIDKEYNIRREYNDICDMYIRAIIQIFNPFQNIKLQAEMNNTDAGHGYRMRVTQTSFNSTIDLVNKEYNKNPTLLDGQNITRVNLLINKTKLKKIHAIKNDDTSQPLVSFNIDDWEQLVKQVTDLRDFYNESLMLILERFESHRKVMKIEHDFTINGHH